MIKTQINGRPEEIEADPAMPILWVVREKLGMNGTKFGCGIAQCGACTVHLDGQPIRSCSTPISAAEGKSITTIEGIADQDGTLSKVQQAWISEQVPQCGYCQSGQIMSATALLKQTSRPTDEQIDTAMKGNVCRCGMYGRIRKAIKVAAGIETTSPQGKTA
jgi:isoquinoline 1-oxidoreductase alpha subunit